jgi:hypothetical protein
MTTEVPGWGKFAKTMSDHVLSYIYGNVAATIMNGNCVPDHLGEDGARAAPGTNDLFLVPRIHDFNFFQ